MAFQPGPNMVEINLNQLYFGEQVQNNLYAIRFEPWTAGQLEVLGGELITWLGTQLYPNLSNSLELSNVELKALDTENSPTFTAVPTVPVQGDVIAEGLPGNVALCISFRSGLSGRSARGRNYVCGIPQDVVTGNTYSGTFAASIRAAYEALPGIFALFGGLHVIASRVANKVERPTIFGFQVTSYVVPNLSLDSMRTRLPGRGN